MRLKYKHQSDKRILRYFKIWQANTLRHELKTICGTLGQTLSTEKRLFIKRLSAIVQSQLRRTFGVWRAIILLDGSTLKSKTAPNFMIQSEPKTRKLLRFLRIIVLKGKQNSDMEIHLWRLKQMYQRTQTNDSLTQKDIVLVQNSHKAILNIVLRKWKVLTVYKVSKIVRKGNALAKLMAITDRVITRSKIDFLTKLSEQQFAAPTVSYGDARAIFRRIKVAAGAMQRILIRHQTTNRSFYKWKYFRQKTSSVAVSDQINQQFLKQRTQQIKIGLMCLSRIQQRHVQRTLKIKLKNWKRCLQQKRNKLMRGCLLRIKRKLANKAFIKWQSTL